MAKPKRPLTETGPTDWPSLGDALRARGVHVGEAADQSPPPEPPSTIRPGAQLRLSGIKKIVVRRERKGHGGKTVTVIDGVTLPAAELETIVGLLRKALGCGGWIDGGRVVLQGDAAAGAAAWLQANGAARVVVGN
jgi:translation initiation factor 1